MENNEKVSFTYEQKKAVEMNRLNLLIADYKFRYDDGFFLSEHRGAENLTSTIICDLMQERELLRNDKIEQLPAHYRTLLKKQ